MTEHLSLIHTPADDEVAIARTAEVLASGGVVAVPTDTVYGLACRSGFSGIGEAHLRAQGPPSRTSRCRGSFRTPTRRSAFVNEIPRQARAPHGPLLAGSADARARRRASRPSRSGFPDHEPLREILRRAGGPVVATSANLSGEDAGRDRRGSRAHVRRPRGPDPGRRARRARPGVDDRPGAAREGRRRSCARATSAEPRSRGGLRPRSSSSARATPVGAPWPRESSFATSRAARRRPGDLRARVFGRVRGARAVVRRARERRARSRRRGEPASRSIAIGPGR